MPGCVLSHEGEICSSKVVVSCHRVVVPGQGPALKLEHPMTVDPELTCQAVCTSDYRNTSTEKGVHPILLSKVCCTLVKEARNLALACLVLYVQPLLFMYLWVSTYLQSSKPAPQLSSRCLVGQMKRSRSQQCCAQCIVLLVPPVMAAVQPSHSNVTFGMLLPGCDWVQVPDMAEIFACVFQIMNPLVNHSQCACITNDH